MAWYREWKPYVPVAKRRAEAAAYAKKLAKKEKRSLEPIELADRKISTTFWGQAWCDNLERYSDFANRLPRGRSYLRNGSILDLQIQRGKVTAIVSGSDIYHVAVDINALPTPAWKQIKRDCAKAVASLIDLLQGRFDQGVMQRLTQAKGGLFPQPREISMRCSCPDWATLCKHVAATLYGVGARLDASPELLFTLRGVDHLELVSEAADATNLEGVLSASASATLADQDLGELFGIELDAAAAPSKSARRSRKGAGSQSPTAAKRDAASCGRARQAKGSTRKRGVVAASSKSKRSGRPAVKTEQKAKSGRKKSSQRAS